MPWLIKADAAHQLGVSLRTLSDRLSEGLLESKRDGNRILIYVPEEQAADMLPEPGPSLAGQTVGVATGVLPHRDVSIIASAMEAVRETRTALEHHARTVKVESDRARVAEHRAAERSRRVMAGSMIAVCVCIFAVAGIGWLFQTSSEAFASEVAGLRQAILAAESSMAAAETGFDAAQAEYREAGALFSREIESLRTAVSDGETAVLTDIAELEARLTAIRAALTVFEAAHSEVVCELEQIAVTQEQFTDDVVILRERVRSVEGLTTLKGLLDRTWDGAPRPSGTSATPVPSATALQPVRP